MNEMNKMVNRISKFFDILNKEINSIEEIYDENSAFLLRKYYELIYNSETYSQYMKHYYIKRILPLIREVREKVKIFDAGCGLGTESILCGWLGGEVVGVDLKEERIEIAKKRIAYYERELNTKIDVSFTFDNIFNHYGTYDVIWMNESISHIHPIDRFLNQCYKLLNPHGKLIIAEGNKLNPYFYYYARKEQKKAGGVICTFSKKDPKTGKDIPYAVERIFSPYSMKSIISKLFEINEVHLIRFFPFILFKIFPTFFKKIEIIFSKLPLIKSLATLYIIKGTKK